MGKKNYRGVIEFGDGSKLKLLFNNSQAAAKKDLLEQARYSNVHGNEYYNFRKGTVGKRNTPGDSGGIAGLYFEVWERVVKHKAHIKDDIIQLLDKESERYRPVREAIVKYDGITHLPDKGAERYRPAYKIIV